MQHVLYETGDKDAPDVIKDRNGEVVLSLCRNCGRGEAELDDKVCIGPAAVLLHRIKQQCDTLAKYSRSAADVAQEISSAISDLKEHIRSMAAER